LVFSRIKTVILSAAAKSDHFKDGCYRYRQCPRPYDQATYEDGTTGQLTFVCSITWFIYLVKSSL